MRAWQVTEWCEPEGMTLGDVAVPEPDAGQVRIQTRAAALNFFDILEIQGKYQVRPPFPFTPGAEVGGVVDAVGPGVAGLAVGDRVLAMTWLGGFGEFCLAPARMTFPIPASMSFAEAAAMPIVYQTAYLALTARGALQPGEWLLVHAAAGGVGSAAVQIGKALGARVIGTAGSDEKLDFVRAQGADHALSYRDDGWVKGVMELTGGGADVIYDPVGGDIFDLSTKCIAPEGRLLVIGFAGGRIPSVAANRLLLKSLSVVGVYWGGYIERHPSFAAEAQAALFAMYRGGQIKPAVSKVYSLDEVPQAMRDLAGRQTVGKVVIAVDEAA
ncbi:MAG: NADPH:quinone oxidoreductase family protein [Anaerolineae bacterium]